MKFALLFLALGLSFPQSAFAAGAHKGEESKVQAVVTFNHPLGSTTTNASGTFYDFGGYQIFEPKVYPSEYFGTFPLYFVDDFMHYSIAVSNTAPKGGKKFKLKITAVHRVLQTDGSLGMQVSPTQEFIVDDLRPGETRMINASAFIPMQDGLESGLDMTTIRIQHLNNGADDAALIKECTAVWCPPSLEDTLVVKSNG